MVTASPNKLHSTVGWDEIWFFAHINPAIGVEAVFKEDNMIPSLFSILIH